MHRILLIQPYAMRLSGVDTVLLELIDGNHASDLEFFVIIPPGSPYIRMYEELGARVVSFPVSVFSKTSSILNLLLPMIRFIPSVLRIYHVIRSNHIDLVHSHQINILAGDIAAKLANVPAIHTIHEIATGPLWPYRIFSTIIRLTCQRIIILCDASGELVTRDWRRLSKIHKIYNGVNTERFAPGKGNEQALREALGVEKDTIVVGAMSRIQYTKGLEFYVEAAADVLRDFSNILFLLVGDTITDEERFVNYKQSLQDQVCRLGIEDRFIFVGLRRDVVDVLAAIDIFVLPSVFDILPTAVLEAMAMGKPVIATRVGGLPEVIIDGLTGFLVPTRSHFSLAEKINTLARDRTLRASMGREGRNRVVDLFAAWDYAANIEKLYRELI
jgi:glycosyltransferase involved in cell wall biosynthesis